MERRMLIRVCTVNTNQTECNLLVQRAPTARAVWYRSGDPGRPPLPRHYHMLVVQRWAGSHDLPRSNQTLSPQVPAVCNCHISPPQEDAHNTREA